MVSIEHLYQVLEEYKNAKLNSYFIKHIYIQVINLLQIPQSDKQIKRRSWHKRMKNRQYLLTYIQKLTQKIRAAQQQWKGTRFAALDDSSLDIDQDDDDNEYQQCLEKYRGKNGDIKPLGLILFNKYLNSLFVLFLALTLLFVPVCIAYSFGGGLSEFRTTSSLSKSLLIFSVASLPRYRLDDLTQANLSQIAFHRYLTLSTDIISISVIFIFTLYLKIVLTKITNEYMAKSPAPNLYCLEIENIQGYRQEHIIQHFSKLGKIAQISGVYTHRDVVYELRNIVKLITHLSHLKPDMKEYEEIVNEVGKKYKEIAEGYLNIPKIKLKSAFLCFNEISTRNRVYDLYKYQINPENLYFQTLPNSESKIQETDKQNRTQIQFKQATQKTFPNLSHKPLVKKCKFEPLTINWENCDIDNRSQNIKFCCQFVLLLIVGFVILLGLFLLNINSSHIRQSSSNIQSSGISQFEKNFSGNKQAKEKYTFCASLTLSDFKWEYYDLCADYLQFEGNRFALMLLFALMVAIINLLTNRILWALVAFRRYRTLAERNSFLITSIFCFSLVNSAILILLVRGHYTGPILRQIVGKLLNFSQDEMLVTVYSQYNRNWYMNIGAQLMINYIVSLVIFPHFHIILHWVRSKYRQIKSKHTQKKLKKPVFNYCTFYAMSLKSIFFALMYSNAMPVFYLLCCIALAVEIGLGKILLKKFVDEPVFVDNNAIEIAVNLIPYALLLHCLTSILFLNVEQIFPTTNSYENVNNSWSQTNFLKFERGFVYIIVFAFLITYIFIRERVDKTIIKYWLGRSQTKAECDQTKRFKDIKNNPAFLSSYKMKDNPKYKILFYALQLFSSHMQRLKLKKQSLPQINSISFNDFFTEEETLQKVNDPNSSALKNINCSKDMNISPQDHQSKQLNSNRKESEEVVSEGQVEEIEYEDDKKQNQAFYVELIKQQK